MYGVSGDTEAMHPFWGSGGTVTGHSEEKMRVVGIRKGSERCECIRDDPRTEH